MKKFNYSTTKMYRDIFEPGKLLNLSETVLSGTDRKEYKGLTVDELAKLHDLYTAFNPREFHVLDLEDKKEYTTKNGKTVLGADIKAITLLMYAKPRSAYVEFGKISQVNQSNYCGAVPIPLLGFKRAFNIPYDSWREYWAKEPGIKTDDQYQIVMLDEEALERAFKIDLYLGRMLASTNISGNEIEWEKNLGLLPLSLFSDDHFFSEKEIIQFRQPSMGNYKHSYATSFGSAKITEYDKKDRHLDIKIQVYNHSTAGMRLMNLQRWAFYGKHRNDDMICNFTNWSKLPKAVDVTSNIFVGLTPKESGSILSKLDIFGG